MKANFVDYMNPVIEYMRHSKQYTSVTSSEKFILKLRRRFEDLVTNRIGDVVKIYSIDVLRLSKFRRIDLITKLHMASVMLPMEKIIPTREMLLPEAPNADASSSSVRQQGQYVMPVDNPRSTKQGGERALQKLAAIKTMGKTQRQDPKLFSIADYVEGGFAQVYPMEWSMIDFDYLRNTAYEYYVCLAMIVSQLLRATLNSEFIDYLLDVSEKTLMKDILNIETEPLVFIAFG